MSATAQAPDDSTRATRFPRAWRAALGLALVIIGGVLLPRPLTSFSVLAWLVPLALLALATAVAIDATRRSAVRIAAPALLVAAAVALTLLHATVLRWLPYVAALLLVAWGVLAFAVAVRARRISPTLRAVLLTAAAIGWLVLTTWWPDLATISFGAAFAAFLVIAGVRLVWRGLRRASPRRHTARGALSWVSTIVAVTVIAVLMSASLALRSEIPQVTAFYESGDPLPDAPGVLIKTEPYEGASPLGSTAVRLLYTTTGPQGEIVLASGVAAIPTAPSLQPRLIASWQHGTTGVDRTCAPSLGTIALNDVAVPGAERMIERGWVIVAPDYPGMGTDGPYPYIIGDMEGHSTLDGIRAAAQLPGVVASGESVLLGHSQGGHATLWAADLADEYAPELSIRAVVALSAANDPLTLAQAITAKGESPITMLATSYVAVPYAERYADVDLDDFVDPAGRVFFEQAAAHCATNKTPIVTMASMAAAMAFDDRRLTHLELDEGPLHDRLAENIPPVAFTAPLFLGQGDADEVVPIALQRTLAARLCEQGRPLTTREYPGKSHMGIFDAHSPLVDELNTWLDSVLAGVNPDNCATP